MHEDVLTSVCVIGNEVGCPAAEGYEAAVRGDGGLVAIPSGLPSLRVHAHARCLPGLPIVNEDVHNPIGITWHQVIGSTIECHKSTIRRDAEGSVPIRLAASLPSERVHADTRRRLPQQDSGTGCGHQANHDESTSGCHHRRAHDDSPGSRSSSTSAGVSVRCKRWTANACSDRVESLGREWTRRPFAAGVTGSAGSVGADATLLRDRSRVLSVANPKRPCEGTLGVRPPRSRRDQHRVLGCRQPSERHLACGLVAAHASRALAARASSASGARGVARSRDHRQRSSRTTTVSLLASIVNSFSVTGDSSIASRSR